ncbi:MAG: hypothetical protein AABY22_26145 [Nanoarchaeota archaeon]
MDKKNIEKQVLEELDKNYAKTFKYKGQKPSNHKNVNKAISLTYDLVSKVKDEEHKTFMTMYEGTLKQELEKLKQEIRSETTKKIKEELEKEFPEILNTTDNVSGSIAKIINEGNGKRWNDFWKRMGID